MRSIIFLLFTIILLNGFAQNDTKTLLAQAKAYDEQFKEPEALAAYKKVLQKDPTNIEALTGASFMSSRIGFRASGEEKRKLYNDGKMYAEKALKLAPTNAEANYVMGVAMGRIAEISDTKEKIEASKEVKKYAEKALQYDKTHAGAWHLLGRWHYGVKDLGPTKMVMIKLIYGSMPRASYETAIEAFNKAINYNPAYILYYLDLAKAYEKLGQDAYAKAVLAKALKLKPLGPDDPQYLREVKAMHESL